MRFKQAAMAACLMAGAASRASGQPFIWATGSGSWGTASNWAGGVAPPTGGGAAVELYFAGSGPASGYVTTNNLGALYGVNRMTFTNEGPGVVTLDGSSLNPTGAAPALVQTGGGDTLITAGLTLTTTTAFGTTGTGVLTLAGALSGAGTLTKDGTGTLTVTSSSSGYSGAVNVNGGTLRVYGAGGELNKALGTGLVTVNGGTLEVSDVTIGTAQQPGTNFVLRDGARLVGTGTSFLHYPSVSGGVGSPKVGNGTSDAPVSVTMMARGAGDVLTISTAVRNSNQFAPSFATVHVAGEGRIVLTAGGLASPTTYAGSWVMHSGILQMGATSGEGEALNALGFKGGNARNGNTVTVLSGTLAGGVVTPITPTTTPDFFRANVVLAGGAIASTNGVNARFGGGFATEPGTTSYVNVFDPVSPGVARDVSLVAGAAGSLNNASGVSLGGRLVVTPGTLTAGGTFQIARDGGTSAVSPGAVIEVLPGAAVRVSGVNTLASPTNGVTLEVGGRFDIAPGTNGTTRLAGLVLTGDGRLDVGNNPLVWDYAGASPVGAVRGHLLSGRNGGAWGGAGISSSPAAADPAKRTAIAYAEASQLGIGTFAGQAVDESTLVMKYTWYGDANMDGRVTPDDFALADRGRATGLSGWVNGDFNYDGMTDAADYALMDRAYGLQVGTLSPEFLATRAADFGAAYVTGLVASVPEPSVVGALVAVWAMTRRRLGQ